MAWFTDGLVLGVLQVVGVVLLPFVLAMWLVRRASSRPPVQHAACANCRYIIAYSPGRRCQECGRDLLQAGVLDPEDGRILRPRRYLALFGLIAIYPAIFAGFFGGAVGSEIAWRRSALGGTEHLERTIIALGPASGEFQHLWARLQYRRDRSGAETYTRLELGAASHTAELPEFSIALGERRFDFTDESIVPPPDMPRELGGPPYRIIHDVDIDRVAVLQWLSRGSIDVENPQVRDEVDAFLDHVQARLTIGSGARRQTELDVFGTVYAGGGIIGFDDPGEAPERVAGLLVGALVWLLLMLIPLYQIGATIVKRRRAAERWVAAAAASASSGQQSRLSRSA